MADPVHLKVHRCRFVDYTPSAVTALAFPPLPLPNPKGKKAAKQPTNFGALVVGHSNGNIDICEWTGRDQQTQSPQAWVVRKTIAGTYPSKVDALALVIRYPDLLEDDQVSSITDLRLFSSGGGNELVEWDMNRGCIRRTINSQGGAIWSIAANPSSSQLALACEDGTVRILSLANDTLTHHRRFDRVKSRILSIAWGPPIPRKQTAPRKPATAPSSDESSDEEDMEDLWSDSWLVTGCSDSSLRKWDAKTGRVVDRMGVDKLRGERTLVWTVGVLGDGTILSGDSLGMVKFWDPRTCTQLQSFRAHGADVLCHAIGPDGATVFTSGVDQKVAQFTRVRASAPGADAADVQSQWVQTRARRLHSHDVRALAMWPSHVCLPTALRRPAPSGIAPVLASGGLDMNVVLTPAAPASATVSKVVNPLATSVDVTFEEAYQRRLAYPASGAVRVAPHARLVACMRDAALTLWRILKQEVPVDEAPADDSESWEKVLEMDLNVNTNMVAHAISGDGRWLAVSDLYETKLFRLDTSEKGAISPRRVRDFANTLAAHLPPSHGSTGGLAFTFTPDSSKLVMSSALGSYVLVIDLGGVDGVPRVLRRFDHHLSRTYALRDVLKRQGAEETGDVDMADGDNDSGIDLPSSSSSRIPAVQRLAVSPDGQWLATSDDHAQTHIFNLDSIQHHCTLPSFGRPAQAIAFDSTQSGLLLLAFPDNALEFYDVEARAFPAWAQELAAHLPKRLAGAHDPVLGVSFPPQTVGSHYALLWGSTWLAKLDLGTAQPRVRRKRRRESRGGAKQEKAEDEKEVKEGEGVEGEEEDERRERDFRMVTHYRPVLHVDYLESGELVVVERPLVDVLALLPPAYFKHRYGAS